MIDLQKFCSQDDGHYTMKLPWVREGKAYATDGRIGIRCNPALYAGTISLAPDGAPNLDKVLEPIEKVEAWKPLPELPECDHCGGRGIVDETCEDCGGTGQYNCRRCGIQMCKECEGEGSIPVTCTKCCVHLANRTVARKYVNLIAALPGLEWGIVKPTSGSAVYFRFEGGEGAVVPIYENEG